MNKTSADATVTSARTNSNVPAVGAPLSLPHNLAMGAQQARLDADIRTSSFLGMPSIKIVHCYYPFTLIKVGGRLAPLAAGWIDRLAISLVIVRRFPSFGAAEYRFWRFGSYTPHEGVCTPVYIFPLPSIPWGRTSCVHSASFVFFHGTFGSYVRAALHEGGASTVACLHAPRTQASLVPCY
jgi:hypothetical protein